jgi:hypothetical protein
VAPAYAAMPALPAVSSSTIIYTCSLHCCVRRGLRPAWAVCRHAVRATPPPFSVPAVPSFFYFLAYRILPLVVAYAYVPLWWLFPFSSDGLVTPQALDLPCVSYGDRRCMLLVLRACVSGGCCLAARACHAAMRERLVLCLRESSLLSCCWRLRGRLGTFRADGLYGFVWADRASSRTRFGVWFVFGTSFTWLRTTLSCINLTDICRTCHLPLSTGYGVGLFSLLSLPALCWLPRPTGF